MEIVFKESILANKKHRILLHEDFDETILWGGRGSAKTLDLVKILIKECLSEEYFNLVVVFPNRDKIREGVYSDFINFIEDYGLSRFFDHTTSPLKISCINGNQIIFRGGQEKENAKGLSEPNRIWFEEANLTPEDSHDVFLSSLRTQKGNIKAFYTFNPESSKIKYQDHWIFRRFFKHLVDDRVNIYDTIRDNGRLIIHSTHEDNPHCPETLIRFIESFSTINPVRYKIWKHGRWSAKDNDLMFAHRFKIEKHVSSVALIPDLPIHLSFDQNFKPYSTCTLYQTYHENGVTHINAFDEICLEPPNNSSERICEVFLKRYDPKSVFIYGDYSGNAKTQKITHSIYKNHYDLIKVKLAKFMNSRSMKVYPNPPRDVRQDIVNSILEGSINFELHIDHKCKNFINDLEQLQIDENGCYKKEKKDGVELLGHTMDTFIYFLHGCFFNLFKG